MNDKTKINSVNGVKFLTFNKLGEIPFVKHGFSTKEGGVSEGIFKSMNLSFTRGDKAECVKENYRRFFDAVGFTLENMVMSDQIHEVDVLKTISNINFDILKSICDNEKVYNSLIKNEDVAEKN